MTEQDRTDLGRLIGQLLTEEPQYRDLTVPACAEERWMLFRALVNLRPPRPAEGWFLALQDTLLRRLSEERGITDCRDLARPLALWQGDITTLRSDAVVNAANSALLGCFRPNHACIDNAIHTYAGVQLRLACAELMERQGHEEPTGTAKLTGGYNLPARHVLHTVGPIVDGPLTRTHCRQLAECYRACLSLAEAHALKSVAFCCISTGVFGFPNRPAAEIAVETVREYMRDSAVKQVIFNVYKDEDYEIYRELL